MKILMLRGKVPDDRSPKEIMYNSIEECMDMWEILAYHLGDEKCEVLYWGGKREVKYSDKCTIKWVKKFKHYTPDFEPDVIFARGGFKEYKPILKRHPKAFKMYYGAGKRYIPDDGIKYDLVLADSPKQKKKLISKGFHSELFFKPAPDAFKPMDIEKKYDVLFVAPIPTDPRKNVKWVHATCPKDLKVLQLGYGCKAPKNFTVKRIKKEKMPKAINKCRVVIAPYTSEDSAPRIISEAAACGVPVIALDTVPFWREKLGWRVSDKKNFWVFVRMDMRDDPGSWDYPIRTHYEENLSIPKAVEHIGRLACGLVK